MSFEQEKIFQKLAKIQGIQAKSEAVPQVEDLDELYREAEELIGHLADEPDPGSLDDLEAFWGETMAAFGEDWEGILDEVLIQAEEAQEQGRPYHHNAWMYWGVLDYCYALLQEEEVELYRELFRECLSCLRAARTLQESLAQERAEKVRLESYD